MDISLMLLTINIIINTFDIILCFPSACFLSEPESSMEYKVLMYEIPGSTER